MTNFNDGKWHGWNGGKCPVHPKTVVQVQRRSETRIEVMEEPESNHKAGLYWDWKDEGKSGDIIAFRVVKEHREPREWWLASAGGYLHTFNELDAAQTYCRCTKGAEMVRVREVLDDEGAS